jgi:hypothetical protein
VSDFVLRYGADTTGVVKAQRDLMRSSKQTAAEVGRLGKNVDETFRTFVSAEAAKQAVMRSVSIAAEAARQSDTLADNFGRVSVAINEFKGRLGDDLAVTFFDDSGATEAGINMLSKARDVAADLATALLTSGNAWDSLGKNFKNARGVTDALRLQRQQEADRRVQSQARLAGASSAVMRAGLSGDRFGAQAAQIELDRLTEQQRIDDIEQFRSAEGTGASQAQVLRMQNDLNERTALRTEALERQKQLAAERLGLEEALARAAATAAEADDRAATRALAVFDARVKAAERARGLGLGDAEAAARGDEAAMLVGRTFDLDDERRAQAEAEREARDQERRERERMRFEDRITQARSRRLRASGKTDEADQLDAQLTIRQAIDDARRSELFTAAELLAYEKRLRGEVEGRLAAEKGINQERDSFRTLSPGSPELAGVVFGRTPPGMGRGEPDAIDLARARRRRFNERRRANAAIARGDAVGIGDLDARVAAGGRRLGETAAAQRHATRGRLVEQWDAVAGGPLPTFFDADPRRAAAGGIGGIGSLMQGTPLDHRMMTGSAAGGGTDGVEQKLDRVVSLLEQSATGSGFNVNVELGR